MRPSTTTTTTITTTTTDLGLLYFQVNSGLVSGTIWVYVPNVCGGPLCPFLLYRLPQDPIITNYIITQSLCMYSTVPPGYTTDCTPLARFGS